MKMMIIIERISIKALTFLVTSLAVISVCSFTYGEDTTQGLIGHWKFDEGEGEIAIDSSGNNRDGALKNGPMWNSGRRGGALYFDGEDDYIDLGDIDEYEFGPDDEFTIALWIMPTSFKKSYFFGKYPQDNYWGDVHHQEFWTWNLYMYERHADFRHGEDIKNNLIFTMGDGTKFQSKAFYYINPDEWYHITIAVGAKNDTIDFYVDGKLIKNMTINRTIGQLKQNSNPVRIGGIYDKREGKESGDDLDAYTEGIIDDVRIYNRKLSPEEIAQLYQPNLFRITLVPWSNRGKIEPSGFPLKNYFLVPKGENRTFVIKANQGYVIREVRVDGVAQQNLPVNSTAYSYTFNNIQKDHILTAYFDINPNLSIASGWRPVETYNRDKYKPLEKWNYHTINAMVQAIRAEGHPIPKGHPRIFLKHYFDEDGNLVSNKDALREKIKTNYLSFMQSIVDLAYAAYGKNIPVIGDNGRPVNGKTDPLPEILEDAFIYQLGEIEGIDYHGLTPLQYGEDGVRYLLSFPNWVDKYGNSYPGGWYRHRTYLEFPLAYDWLYELMTEEERNLVAEQLLDMAEPNNSQVMEYNNIIGRRLLGALAVYGDGYNDARAQRLLDTFYKGFIFGKPSSGDSWYNFIETLLRTPEGPGVEGFGYGFGYGLVFYPFLEAWYDQTGEDYSKMPFIQELMSYFTHFLGNEYEHVGMGQGYSYKKRMSNWVPATFETLLLSSNPTLASLAKYHKEKLSQGRKSAMSILKVILSDPNLPAKSPKNLSIPTTAHFRVMNDVFARNKWEGIDSTWIWFQSPIRTTVRNGGPLNNFYIWKNGGFLFSKRSTHHDYGGGNRANTIVFYDTNIPNTTFIPQNVMDWAGNRGGKYGGPHKGLRYFEEKPGEYAYMFGDGGQIFQGYKKGSLSGDILELKNWSRQFIWFRTTYNNLTKEYNNNETDHFIILDRIKKPNKNITEGYVNKIV